MNRTVLNPSIPAKTAEGCELSAFLSDEDREQLIDACHAIVSLDPERLCKQVMFRRMAELIRGGSPQVIERMERERGLR